MASISKRLLNELCNSNFINKTFRINDSNRVDSKDKQYDVFFSYCYTDKEYAIKMVNLFEKLGYKVYIDLRDSKLSRTNVDRSTVERIAEVMNRCKSLVYMHTRSATVSKWCPWELGYMSGNKNFRCATILLTEDKEDFPRQEYLEIYPYLDYEKVKDGEEYDFWANELDTGKYVRFNRFINGENPSKHD